MDHWISCAAAYGGVGLLDYSIADDPSADDPIIRLPIVRVPMIRVPMIRLSEQLVPLTPSVSDDSR